MKHKFELVAPGGSLEKIEYAYHFGADAAYAGLPVFSLRARINEFNEKKLEKAVKLARSLGKKIYFTLNIYAHERHLPELKKHLRFVAKIKPDAVIISDPGIVSLVKKIAPLIKIHLSTQANTTNSEAVKFWQSQGISRIILAREVTLDEIKKIRKACPKIELEYFVHGAMCMSLSGRCLLSRWMRGRSANLGDCIQPCRWKYHLQEFPISNFQFPNKSKIKNKNDQNRIDFEEKKIVAEEDEQGTYLFNSKDLCLIEHLDKLADAGINSFKIEGRTKSAYYVACAVKAYRKVLDAIKSGKNNAETRKISASEKKELEKLVNRGYSTGFLFGKDKWENDFEKSHQGNQWQFVGEVFDKRGNSGDGGNWARIKIHNTLKIEDRVEIVSPDGVYPDKVSEIKNHDGERIKSAHGGGKSFCLVRFGRAYPEKSIIRKKSGLPEKRKTG
ncbi:MAG: U32 family peptidase C-terminal domain-containing protein [Candidatus Moranbacteria bacterium]|nr:U32 family peptidase C-terminal domain-containing protein [Candidatus Moranbacteria bacterium]